MDPQATRGIVYVVDDDDAVRRALTRLIRSSGMRVEAYASPQELLDQERRDPVHCLLLDVQLPGMSGFELNERLVAAGRGAPVVFITAHADGRTRERAAVAGAEAFLEKPCDDDDLLSALRGALDQCV